MMKSIPLDSRPRIAPRARLQSDKITGKPVLLYPEGVRVLNETGHAIVLRCTGQQTCTEIIAELAQTYQVAPGEIQGQVVDYLQRLRARNVLELAAPSSKA